MTAFSYNPAPVTTDALKQLKLFGQAHLVCIDSSGKVTGKDFGDNHDNAIGYADAGQIAEKNIYITVNNVRTGTDKKPTKSDIVDARFIHADIDGSDGEPLDKDKAINKSQTMQFPPTMIADSGNGLHMYWKLEGSHKNFEAIESINRQVAHHLGGDMSCFNIDRVLRLVDYDNIPNAAKIAKGRERTKTKMLFIDESRVYEAADIGQSLLPAPEQSKTNGRVTETDFDPADLELLTPRDIGLESGTPVYDAIMRPKGEDRSADGLAATRLLAYANKTDEQIAGILLNADNPVSEHFLSQKYEIRAVERAVSKVRVDTPYVPPIDIDFDALTGRMESRKIQEDEAGPTTVEAELARLDVDDMSTLAEAAAQLSYAASFGDFDYFEAVPVLVDKAKELWGETDEDIEKIVNTMQYGFECLRSYEADCRLLLEHGSTEPSIEWGDDHHDEILDELHIPASKNFDTAGLPRLWWREDLDGLLALLVKNINDQCHRDQPELALAAAIPIVGALAGRRYQWPDGLMSNIYTIGIARTASGKDKGLQVADTVFEAADCINRQMGDHIASGQGLANSLVEHPTKFLGIDEYGKFVERTSGGKSSNNEALIGTHLLSLFSGRDFKGSEKANKTEDARQSVSRPALSIYGVTTPSTLFKALNSGASLEGSLNRNLFFFAPDKNPPQREPLAYELTAQVSMLARRIDSGAKGHDTFPIAEAANIKPNPYTVPVTDEAKALLNVMYADHDELINHDDELVNAAYGRSVEVAKKLALIKAVSRNPERPEITESDLLWGGRISFSSAQRIAAECRDHVADNEHQEKIQRLLRLIKESGRKGITKSKLTGKTRWLTASERNNMLDDLSAARSILTDADKTAGRPASKYLHAKFAN